MEELGSAMTSFEFPEMRWDLTDAVEQLVFPIEQLELGPAAIAFAVSILLDDFHLGDERPELIGAFLLDEEEMKLAAAVAYRLDFLVSTLGPSAGEEEFRKHEVWPELVHHATQLLRLLYRDCAGASNCPDPVFLSLEDNS